MIIDGWAPQLAGGLPALRRIIVRKLLAEVKVSMSFDKKTQQGIETSFNAFFVSGSVSPSTSLINWRRTGLIFGHIM